MKQMEVIRYFAIHLQISEMLVNNLALSAKRVKIVWSRQRQQKEVR